MATRDHDTLGSHPVQFLGGLPHIVHIRDLHPGKGSGFFGIRGYCLG
jgi:hypothetical protein